MSGAPCPGWRHSEHTADVLIEAWGRTLEESLEEAARAVYEVMTNTSKVEPKVKLTIEAEGIDLYNLIYRWIEAMLAYTDSEGLVFGVFRVCDIEEGSDDKPWRIRSIVWGEKFDYQKHEHRTIVKAMTYAQMEVKKDRNGCWKTQFVVDI